MIKKQRSEQNIDLPEFGQYALGVFFFDKHASDESIIEFENMAKNYNLKILCWRTVPVDLNAIGEVSKQTEPLIKQAFIIDTNTSHKLSFKKRCYLARKRTTHLYSNKNYLAYICSLSSDTVVYKGLVTPEQLWYYYLDLKDPDYKVYLALVHSRFSTNTFPSWERAHPFRYVAHNGEINTLRGKIILNKSG